MWTFYLNINDTEYNFEPLNKDEFTIKDQRLPRPYSDVIKITEFTPMLNDIILNSIDLFYSEFNEYLITDKNTECYFIVKDDFEAEVYRGYFTGLDIKTDNNNRFYEISHSSNNAYSNILSKTGIVYNLYENMGYGVTINKPASLAYQGDIKGGLRLQDILNFFIKELIGTDYSLESSFLNNDVNPVTGDFFIDPYASSFVNPYKFLYFTQSSNVVEAVGNASYDGATVFDMTWTSFVNILYRSLGLVFKIDEESKVLIVENLETDINNQESGYDFTDGKYSKFFSDKNKYAFKKVDIPNSETWSASFVNDRFKSETIIYDIDATRRAQQLDNQYDVPAIFDMLGMSSKPDEFSKSLAFIIAVNSNRNILYEESDFISKIEETATTNDVAGLNSLSLNAYKNNQLSITGFTEATIAQSAGSLVSYALLDEFIVTSGDKIYIDLYGTLRGAFLKFTSKGFDISFSDIKGMNNMFIVLVDADNENDLDVETYTPTDFMDWAGAISEPIYVSEYFNDGMFGYPLKGSYLDATLSFESTTQEFVTANKTTSRAKLLLVTSQYLYALLDQQRQNEEGEIVKRQPITELSLKYNIYQDGLLNIYNAPLTWANLISKLQTNERYLNSAYFSGTNKQIELTNNVRTRLNEAVHIPIMEYSSVDLSKMCITPFGADGQSVTSEYNPMNSIFTIQFAYDQEKRPFTKNYITKVIFDGQQGFASINNDSNKIVATLGIGFSITDIDMMFVISEKATINKSGSQDFTNKVLYTVTAENGDQREYEVTVIENKPMFTIGLDFDNPFPTSIVTFNTTDLSSTTFRGDNCDPSEVIGQAFLVNECINPCSVSTNIADFSKVNDVTVKSCIDEALDLTYLTSLTKLSSPNGSIIGVNLPINSLIWSQILLVNNKIQSLDLSPLSGVCDGITINLSVNEMTSEIVDSVLFSIALKGWLNMTIYAGGIGDTNEAPLYAIMFISALGGINHVIGDILTPTDGSGTGLEIEITGVSSGAITNAKIKTAGIGYSTIPTTFVSSGIGTGETTTANTSYSYITTVLTSTVTVTA